MEKKTFLRIILVMFLCMNLAVPPGLMAQGTKEEAAKQEGPAFRPEEIDQMVAPIALYPDSLLAQVLAASTYPLEIVQAARFVQQNKNLKGDKLMAMPQICDVGGEVYRIKEAVVDEDVLPGWGKLAKRGPMWEAACASARGSHPPSFRVKSRSISLLPESSAAGLLPNAASSFFTVTWFRSTSYSQNLSPSPTMICS